MTFIQRRLNVDATSWRCIDVEATLYRRLVSAGYILSKTFQIAPGAYWAFTRFSLRPSWSYKFKSTHSEDKKGTNRGSTEHNLAPVLILVLPLRQNHESNRAFCIAARNYRSIKKTRLFIYIENFTSKKWKISDKNLWYFSYFCSKHRLWVLVRIASARRF